MDDKTDQELLAELDLSPPTRINGNLRVPFFIEYERDLTEADMIALSLPRGSTTRQLVRIHSSHHSLARCLATGMKLPQASLVTGYSISRVTSLQSDPAFQALVADYQTEAKSIFADLAERMSDMSLDAIEVLQERLQDKPEEFTTSMLLDVIKSFADRTGHGPNQDLHLKVSQDFIDRPPRESFEDWERRRTAEITGPTSGHTMSPEPSNVLTLVPTGAKPQTKEPER